MSWWIDTPDFYAEAKRRASMRVNKAERPVKGPAATFKAVGTKKAPLLPTAPKLCAVCGDPFSLNLRGPQRIYCSHACNQKAWKQRRRRQAA